MVAVTCAMGILAIGCSKSYHMTGVSELSAPRTAPRHVQVFSPADKIDQPYLVLGKVFVKRWGNAFLPKGKKGITGDIKAKAAEIGADAIVGFTHSRQDDKRKKGTIGWGTGLAVKFLERGVEQPSRRYDFIVAIRSARSITYDEWRQELEHAPQRPRAKKRLDANEDTIAVTPGEVSYARDDFVKDSINMEKNWAGLVSAVQYQLEKRGYYATFADEQAATVRLEQLVTLEDSVANNLFGAMTGNVLYINMTKTDSYNAGLAAGASSHISARLYSRAERKVVWEGSASGSLFPTIGLFNVLAESGSSRQNQAVCMAVEEAFKTLAEAESNSE